MSAFLLALLISVCSGVWIFTKMNQTTGYGNSGNAIKGAAAAGVGIFVVVFTVGLIVLK